MQQHLANEAAKHGRIIDKNEDMILVTRSRPNRAGWRYTDERHLVGVDDGNVFVSRVPGNVKTVRAALDWLCPALSRHAEAFRQGDIWFRPMGAKEAARVNVIDAAAEPVTTWELHGSRHTLVGEVAIVGGVEYIRGTVKAPDHPDLILHDWHVSARNRQIIQSAGD